MKAVRPERPALDAARSAGQTASGKTRGVSGKREILAFAARVALAALVLGLLLAAADLGSVLQAISRVSPTWLALAVLVQLAGKFVWAMRWSATLEIFGLEARLGRLVRGIFIGQFFNNFLPSSVGGDFYRGYWILDDAKLYGQSMLLVFLERFLGLIALGFIAFPALLSLVVWGGAEWSPGLLAILGLLAALCGTTIFLHPTVYEWIDGRMEAIRVRALMDLRRKVSRSLRLLHQAGWWRSRAFVLSLAVQFVGVAFYYCLGRALGVPMTVWQYLVVVPLVTIATVLPVTVNGIGVREGTLVLLAGALRMDMTASEGLALGLLSSAMLVMVSIVGGGFYIAGKRRDSRAD